MASKPAAVSLLSLQAVVTQRASSPYTVQNLDAAITHLERVLCDDSLVIFGATYWRARIREAEATPGLLHVQRQRLHVLLERFPGGPPDTAANTAPAARHEVRTSHRRREFACPSCHAGR
jgi:hypothetical protein